MKIKDMEKMQSPFVRNEDTNWLVIDKIADGMEWVFGEDVMAIEKLHGANISILIQGGAVTGVWNRKRRITMFSKGNQAIMEGLTNSTTQISKLTDGQHFGELIGPSLHNNPYKLEKHVWIPFETFGQKNLKFKSWGKYPKDFDTISEWFKDLMTLYSLMKHGKNETDLFVEGIVFTHKDGRMAKLRRDMFSWFSGRRHKE